MALLDLWLSSQSQLSGKHILPLVGGVENCEVEIGQASEPLFTKLIDSDGRIVEEFYVRSGNPSQTMPLRQIQATYGNALVMEIFYAAARLFVLEPMV